MHRIPIESNGKFRIIQGQDQKYVYGIPEINENIPDDPTTDHNESEYIVCYSCEAIRQQMENDLNLHPYAIQGWNYVRITEYLNFNFFAPEKVAFLKKMGFDELQGSLWCRECGSAVIAKAYMKEHEQSIEISFSFNKNEEQVDKIVFKMPAEVSIKLNPTFNSIGKLIMFNEASILNTFEIKSIGSSDYNIIKDDIIYGRLKLNPNRNEISLMMNRNENIYSENTTYSIYIDKKWFLNLESVDLYDVMQVAKFNIVNNEDKFIEKYVGYVKLDEYAPVHNPDNDWDVDWPIQDDPENPGGNDPDPIGIKNILTWGLNNFGQLGDGTTINRIVEINDSGNIVIPANPVINLLPNARIVKAGRDHTIAIKEDGTVWTWGRNNIGQLGLTYRDESAHSFPNKLNDLSGIIDVAGGWFHSVALDNNGTVWTWGGNYKGQLGDGTNTAKSRPVQVKVIGTGFLTGIVAVAAGSEHTIALDSAGRVWEWGEDQFYPKLVENLSDIVAIATGSWHSLALKNDGTVWAWGYNWSGQLGVGFEEHPDYINERGEYVKAIQVLYLNDITAIDCGSEHSLALKKDGTVWSWGNNDKGQLGIDIVKMNKYYPVQVQNISNVKIMSAGEYHNFVALEDKSIWAWGDNEKGQLCLNNFDNQPSPVFIEAIPKINEIKYLNCGNYHNFAIKVTTT